MVRVKMLSRSAWWSAPRWPVPGVFTISTSSPSSAKKPSSRATRSGRSWIAFIIEALTFLRLAAAELMARPSGHEWSFAAAYTTAGAGGANEHVPLRILRRRERGLGGDDDCKMFALGQPAGQWRLR